MAGTGLAWIDQDWKLRRQFPWSAKLNGLVATTKPRRPPSARNCVTAHSCTRTDPVVDAGDSEGLLKLTVPGVRETVQRLLATVDSPEYDAVPERLSGRHSVSADWQPAPVGCTQPPCAFVPVLPVPAH